MSRSRDRIVNALIQISVKESGNQALHTFMKSPAKQCRLAAAYQEILLDLLAVAANREDKKMLLSLVANLYKK